MVAKKSVSSFSACVAWSAALFDAPIVAATSGPSSEAREGASRHAVGVAALYRCSSAVAFLFFLSHCSSVVASLSCSPALLWEIPSLTREFPALAPAPAR